MPTLTRCYYAGKADLPRIVKLINDCEAIDKIGWSISVAELELEFDAPALDKQRDLSLWEEANGTLVGFGQLWIPEAGREIIGSLWFCVHPQARGQDFETQIIDWGAARMRQIERERGVPVKLSVSVHADTTEQLAILERHGFVRQRTFLQMARSLWLRIPAPQFPPGFTLRPLDPHQETAAWLALFNESFAGHWNHYDLSLETLHYWRMDPDYHPEYDLVVTTPTGNLAAFCCCEINWAENTRQGRKDGWLKVLGVRPAFRGKGLGRAMLLAGLQQLKAAGMDTVKLGVDTANATGALRLYEATGFNQARTLLIYVREV